MGPGINQQLDGNISDALYAGILPSITNPFSTEIVVDINVAGRVYGARTNYVSASSITVGTVGESSVVKSSDNLYLMVWAGTLPLDITVSGVGGLDTGLEGINSWYAVYVIGDSTGVNTPNTLFSLSFIAPTLPVGYDKFRRVGAVRNNGAGDFLVFLCTDKGVTRQVWYTQSITGSVLSGGTAIVRTAVDCSSLLPPTSRQVKLNCQFRNDLVGAGAGDFFILYVTGVAAFLPEWIGTPGIKLTSTIGQIRPMEMPTSAAQSIDYLVANVNDTLSLTVQGYTDNL